MQSVELSFPMTLTRNLDFKVTIFERHANLTTKLSKRVVNTSYDDGVVQAVIRISE